MTTFLYDDAILKQFPQTVGGVILAQNIRIADDVTALQDVYSAEQKMVREQIGSTPLSEIPSLSAWRQVFRVFNVDPTKYRSAPESLLRRLTKKGDIPYINPLVDIGNLISIRYALPVAVFDTHAIQGIVRVHFAQGHERYRELGHDEAIHPDVGEVVFSDEQQMVIARRWCWRQSAESAAQLSTKNALITIEAQHEDGHNTVTKAVNDCVQLLETYTTTTLQYAILDANQPVI